jgi:nucleotide-binding universal stress UspA family protein
MHSTTRIGAELPDGQYRLLVPVFEDVAPMDTERGLQTAAAIARERGGGLVVCYITTVSRQTPLDTVRSDGQVLIEAREAVTEFVEIATEMDVPVMGRIHLTRERSGSILNAVAEYECDGVLLTSEAGRSQRRRLLSGATVEKVVARAECEVFVEKQAAEETQIAHILLAVSGGPHSGLAAKTARALALDADARVDIVHFLGEDATADERDERDDGERIVGAAERALFSVDRTLELDSTANVAEAIIARSDEYDVTVLGSPTGGLLEQFVFGTVPDSVNQRSENAVVMAQQDTGSASVYDRWVAGDPAE